MNFISPELYTIPQSHLYTVFDEFFVCIFLAIHLLLLRTVIVRINCVKCSVLNSSGKISFVFLDINTEGRLCAPLYRCSRNGCIVT